MEATYLFQLPVYLDWIDEHGRRQTTTGQQLDSAIHELLLATSPWTDDWTTALPYYPDAGQRGHAHLAAVVANHQRHQAVMTIAYHIDETPRSDHDFITLIQVFLKTLLNRFCQRSTFGVREPHLAARFAGNLDLAGVKVA